jgi:hypothetical protein
VNSICSFSALLNYLNKWNEQCIFLACYCKDFCWSGNVQFSLSHSYSFFSMDPAGSEHRADYTIKIAHFLWALKIMFPKLFRIWDKTICRTLHFFAISDIQTKLLRSLIVGSNQIKQSTSWKCWKLSKFWIFWRKKIP